MQLNRLLAASEKEEGGAATQPQSKSIVTNKMNTFRPNVQEQKKGEKSNRREMERGALAKD